MLHFTGDTAQTSLPRAPGGSYPLRIVLCARSVRLPGLLHQQIALLHHGPSCASLNLQGTVLRVATHKTHKCRNKYLLQRSQVVAAQEAWYYCIPLMPQPRAEIVDDGWHATLNQVDGQRKALRLV